METAGLHTWNQHGRMNILNKSPTWSWPLDDSVSSPQSFHANTNRNTNTNPNTTVSFPFVDSTACRHQHQYLQQHQHPSLAAAAAAAAAACRIHYPLEVVYGGEPDRGTDATADNQSNNIHNRDFYMVTQKGFKEGPNQDRSFLLSPLMLESTDQSTRTNSRINNNSINNNSNSINTHNHDMLMVGLFDGHAAEGHVTAEAAVDAMPRRLLANLELAQQELVSKSQSLPQSPSQQSPASASSASSSSPLLHPSRYYPSPATVQNVLSTTFLQVDRDRSIQQVPSGGATAVVILQLGPTVYLASAGDSTAFVARYRKAGPSSSSSRSTKGGATAAAAATATAAGEVVIVSTARRHKPADPDEHARITAHGGTVFIPPGYDQPGQTSRVVVGGMGLAMSRCLGDLGGKPSGILTAEPTIRTLNLLDYRHHHGEEEKVEEEDGATGTGEGEDEDDQFFVVVASDGVVDFMSIQHVAEQVAASLYERTSTSDSTPSLAQTCHSLIYESSLLWHTALEGKYRDDMTLVVSKLSL
jgi:serine/threonine protein phosphatase PrpC